MGRQPGAGSRRAIQHHGARRGSERTDHALQRRSELRCVGRARGARGESAAATAGNVPQRVQRCRVDLQPGNAAVRGGRMNRAWLLIGVVGTLMTGWVNSSAAQVRGTIFGPGTRSYPIAVSPPKNLASG